MLTQTQIQSKRETHDTKRRWHKLMLSRHGGYRTQKAPKPSAWFRDLFNKTKGFQAPSAVTKMPAKQQGMAARAKTWFRGMFS